MERLSDELLLEALHQAKELNLSADFILLIEEELEHREIRV